jgi:hypothetical protein
MSAPIVEKKLIGKIDLVSEMGLITIFKFSLPNLSGTGLPNALDNSVLEEVYINCDLTGGGMELYLPSIKSFRNAWNTKIYITLSVGTPGISSPLVIIPYTEEPDYYDTINGNSITPITEPFQVAYLHITSDKNWSCFLTQ